jgi:hypothetical protein
MARASWRAWCGILGRASLCDKSLGQCDDEMGRKRRHARMWLRLRRTVGVFIRIWPKLFMKDLANVETGIYPLPADHDGSLLTLLHRSRLLFEDLPESIGAARAIRIAKF